MMASGGGNRVIGGRNAPKPDAASGRQIAYRKQKHDFIAGRGSSLALITAKVY